MSDELKGFIFIAVAIAAGNLLAYAAGAAIAVALRAL